MISTLRAILRKQGWQHFAASEAKGAILFWLIAGGIYQWWNGRLLSLPTILGTTLATVPANIPYVFADAHLVAYWQRELRGFHGLKVGIAWQGNPKYPDDRRRSIPDPRGPKGK